MQLTLPEIQAIHTEILSQAVRICERHNVKYCMAYGSVLGVVRHKGPIPWDDDVDLAIPFSQIGRFVKYARNELDSKYFVDYYDTNEIYPLTFPRIGLTGYSTANFYFDVFSTIGAPPAERERRKFGNLLYILSKLHFYKVTKIGWLESEGARHRLRRLLFKSLLMVIPRAKIIRWLEIACTKYPLDDSQYVINPGGPYGLKEFIKNIYYNDVISATYSGLEVKIPRLYEAYLRHFYKDFMVYPANHRELLRKCRTLVKVQARS